MLRQPDGSEQILYDCTTDSTDAPACAAMDPAVSFDGKRIAFSVFRGTLAPNRENFSVAAGGDDAYHDLPGELLTATEAQLHIVDVDTGEVVELPHRRRRLGRRPRLAARWTHRVHLEPRRQPHHDGVGAPTTPGCGSRIWIVDPDGRNLDLASHHSLSPSSTRWCSQDGRIAYSSWQIFGGMTFRYTNGSPGGFGTIGNAFNIFSQAPDGAGPFAFYGQHCGDHTRSPAPASITRPRTSSRRPATAGCGSPTTTAATTTGWATSSG